MPTGVRSSRPLLTVLALVLGLFAVGATCYGLNTSSIDLWELAWQEDFRGTKLNTSVWTVKHNQSHCCPEELQLYLEDDVYLANGTLVLRTQRRNAIVRT